MKTIASAFVLVFVATLEAGCSSSSDSSNGSAPMLDDVTLDKSEIAVNALAQVRATLAYADPDGDVATVKQQITFMGTSEPETSLAISEAAGQKQGTLAIALSLGAPTAGTADIAFWLVDAKGNESNKVHKNVTAK